MERKLLLSSEISCAWSGKAENGANMRVCGAKKLGMEWILQFMERIFLRWSELARLWSEKIRDGAKFMFCGVKFFWVEGILEDLGEELYLETFVLALTHP